MSGRRAAAFHRRRSSPRAAPLLRLSLAGLLVLCACSPLHARPQQPSIAVLPFDLFDLSADQRQATVTAMHRWVDALAVEIRDRLRADRHLNVVDTSNLGRELKTLAARYTHPTSCHDCMLALGRRAGADYVLIGQTHKISNLVTVFEVQVVDVNSGKTVYGNEMRADGADSNAMWRHVADSLAAGVAQSSGLQKQQ